MSYDSRRRHGVDRRFLTIRAAVEVLEHRRLLSSYFVATTGADNNPGTLAQPFATIQQAANLAQPGDTVFIRGGTYRETVTPAHSGTAAAPIVFEPYNGELVTVNGADVLANWAPYQGSIFAAAQPWDLGPGNNEVFVDRGMVNEARWPNGGSDLFHQTMATADSITSSVGPNGPFGGAATATLKSAALTEPVGTWVGATIHIAPGEGWAWQTGTVTSSQPGQLTYQYTQLNTQFQIPRAGNAFFLTGKFRALDAPSEWFRDSTTGALYLWTPQGDSPLSHTVEVKRRLYAFDLSNLSYVDVRGVNLFASTIITNGNSHNLVMSNLNAQYVSSSTINPNPFGTKLAPATTGIIINGSNNLLSDSTIAFSSGNGVALDGSNNIVQNCFIHDVDYTGADEAAITIQGNDDQALHNSVWNTGRNGITQYFSTGDRIVNNVIHDFGLMTSDAGGAYSWQTDGGGSEIAYNLIFNGRAGGFGNTGVFLDNGDSHFIIHHNVVWNTDNAVKLSAPAHADQVYNNTLVGVQFSLGTSYPTDMAGSIIENNILAGPVWFGNGVTQQDNLNSTAPGFVNAAGSDYRLAANSPAVDAGLIIHPYTDGYLGRAPDLGAYESGAPAFAAGATAVTPPIYTPPPDTTPPPGGTPPPVGTPPPTIDPTPRAATGPIFAAAFDSMSGVQVTPDGTVAAPNAAWLHFASLDFATGVKSISLQLAASSVKTNIRIQVRLDSLSGPMIGTIRPTTGRRGLALHIQSAAVRHIKGVHDLYLVFTGRTGQLNVEWFSFTPIPIKTKKHA